MPRLTLIKIRKKVCKKDKYLILRLQKLICNIILIILGGFNKFKI